nr:type II toxin-antitoxin system RelE/ParE family toxin [Desulfatirhabdium butyrativorans]
MNEGFISCFLLENARPNHAFGVISGGFRQVPAASQNSPPSGSGSIQNGFSVQALYSIRINQQYRICFQWKDGHADEVEIVDYH